MKKGQGSAFSTQAPKVCQTMNCLRYCSEPVRKESVLQLSSRLLQTFDGLRLLKEASAEELSSISGIGRAKAVQILAALELGRRIHSLACKDRYVIRFPEDAANF